MIISLMLFQTVLLPKGEVSLTERASVSDKMK